MKCGECGGTISGAYVRKTLKGSGEKKMFIYYYCHSARKYHECSQGLYTNANDLEAQILEQIETFAIIPKFKDWALSVLREQDDEQGAVHAKIVESHRSAMVAAERQMANLTRMRISELIDDEEYMREKTRLQSELTSLKVKTSQVEASATDWTALTARAFEFACNAREAFLSGDEETKKAIFAAIGSNHTLTDHKLSVNAAEWLVPFAIGRDSFQIDICQLEPTIQGFPKRQNRASDPALSSLRE